MPVSLACKRLYPAIACGFLLAVFISGCSTLSKPEPPYKPTDIKGQSCLATCKIEQNQCEQRQKERNLACEAQIRMVKGEDYKACTDHYGKYCLKADSCLSTNTGICQTRYQECETNCRALYPAKPVAPAASRDAAAESTPDTH